MFIQALLPVSRWLSTTWVLGEFRRADDVYQEHLRIIEALGDALKARDDRVRVLERENARVLAKLQALHHRQFKPNKKKEVEDGGKDVESTVTVREGEKKKRGAPGGTSGMGPAPAGS